MNIIERYRRLERFFEDCELFRKERDVSVFLSVDADNPPTEPKYVMSGVNIEDFTLQIMTAMYPELNEGAYDETI